MIPYSLTSEGGRSKGKMNLKVSFISNKRRIFKQESLRGKISYHYKQCIRPEYNGNDNVTNGSETSSQFLVDCKLKKQVPELRYPSMHVHVSAHIHCSPSAIT